MIFPLLQGFQIGRRFVVGSGKKTDWPADSEIAKKQGTASVVGIHAKELLSSESAVVA